ncbi:MULTISPECIES: roadblock/LC7 domain-containing protein [Desulfococcus]|uniref:Roadblock/LC7 family protein n=1 Tax=Desulfococcus multivorans DSM 2059 TaxID=1121405 RepID=S7TQ76_DESML|nr:roadblock/LC7 domain-containing protein [Desulfococcus multivorans]AOY58972.1 MglB: putative gliding motility regulatory protein [Desulfococcus multivorans]AQV01240.1 gliding motility protein [Desulfococcus multivorans]EPR39121.1 Roadblock/LC7 family protein [Desulfococcus multivorans DSM 2059]MDX9819184.1 roadblock/LC7 domain-containing protein [Desulfococcus multivorans]SJZ54474.1 Predicted regulator of Ras-like GTPase activity, Roadblock/LC7/MglB family [Desulfococcus multivorans DSM 205
MTPDFNEDLAFSSYAFSQEQLETIESIILKDLVESGAHSILLIDLAGNIIAKADNGECDHDLYSLAALASANFAAVDTMARLIGESEFSLLFHKGEKESIHFSKVKKDFLLISIFGTRVSLGLLRLKVAEAIDKISAIWD